MRIGITLDSYAAGSDLEGLIARLRELEDQGFASAWVPNIFGLDAITALAIAGRETKRIELGTAVVPTYPRHPVAMAQQALTAQVACGGRFTLGLGLSHKVVVESMFGLSYDRPARHMREYLQVLSPLLDGQPTAHAGELYRVAAGLQFAGVPRVPVLIAALGPAMLKVTGALAEGTITWMTGPNTIETHIVPTIREAAKEAGRPEPRIGGSFPIALTHDPDGARQVAAKVFAVYSGLPSYRAMLDREGLAGPADLAIVGDEAALEAGLRRIRDSGVTDLSATLFPADEGAIKRTTDFLASQL
jgi:F420-dependent oxidoreductase-like protein